MSSKALHKQSQWTKTPATQESFDGTTYVAFVLDGSNSMRPLKEVSISGFNEFLNAQQRKPGDCRFTLTIFDTALLTPLKNQPIADVADLDGTRYTPETGGMTALYDAIGQTVKAVEADVTDQDRALVVILTDGMENSSREYDGVSIREMITSYESKGNWTFTYLSASPTAFADAARIGTQAGNVATFEATPQGVSVAMDRVNAATSTYRSGMRGQSTSFYGDQQDETESPESTATATTP